LSLGQNGYKFDDLDWLPVKNDGEQTIPAFGIMRITGMTTIQGRPTYLVERPTEDLQPVYLINSPCQIKADGYGRGTFGPYFALTDPSGSSGGYGTSWGAVKDQFYLKPFRPGFMGFGSSKTDGHKRAIFKAIFGPSFLGKVDGSDVKVWGDASTYTETTMKVPKLCWLGDVDDEAKVKVEWINGRWEITASSCD
jgi:hypothetical protein